MAPSYVVISGVFHIKIAKQKLLFLYLILHAQQQIQPGRGFQL